MLRAVSGQVNAGLDKESLTIPQWDKSGLMYSSARFHALWI